MGYFEVGNHKISLYGRAAYHYKYHEDVESSVNRTNTGYKQTYDQSTRNDTHKWIGELLLKYLITSNDYFAAQFYDSYNSTEGKAWHREIILRIFRSCMAFNPLIRIRVIFSPRVCITNIHFQK